MATISYEQKKTYNKRNRYSMDVFIITIISDIDPLFVLSDIDPLFVLKERKNIAKFVGLDTRTLTKHLRDEYHCLTNEITSYYTFADLENCEAAIEYLKTLLIVNEMMRY